MTNVCDENLVANDSDRVLRNKRHQKVAFPVSCLQPERLLGTIQDNTSTNVAAMRIMDELQPRWLNLGCHAHALDLVLKSLCKQKEGKDKETFCRGVAEVLSVAREMSNAVGDNTSIRELLQVKQRAVYGKVQIIERSSPTRFANMEKLVGSLLKNKEAICAARADPERWDDAAQGSKYETTFDVVNRKDFWKKLDAVHELMKPVAQAIHQLEAAKPMLSQVYKVWKDLLSHVKAWDKKHKEANRALVKGVIKMFEARYNKFVTPPVVAAYILDPANAVCTGKTNLWTLPFDKVTDPKMMDLAFDVVCRIAAAKPEKAREEWYVVGLPCIFFLLLTFRKDGIVALNTSLSPQEPGCV